MLVTSWFLWFWNFRAVWLGSSGSGPPVRLWSSEGGLGAGGSGFQAHLQGGRRVTGLPEWALASAQSRRPSSPAPAPRPGTCTAAQHLHSLYDKCGNRCCRLTGQLLAPPACLTVCQEGLTGTGLSTEHETQRGQPQDWTVKP